MTNPKMSYRPGVPKAWIWRAAWLFLTALIAATGAARTKPRPAPIDADYVAALATANRFLHAWQTQDHETGLMMLTDRARQGSSEDSLDQFFSPDAASAQAFEINRGKKLQTARYSFPVVLWQATPGKEHRLHPRYSSILIVRTGKDDWAVDKLP